MDHDASEAAVKDTSEYIHDDGQTWQDIYKYLDSHRHNKMMHRAGEGLHQVKWPLKQAKKVLLEWDQGFDDCRVIISSLLDTIYIDRYKLLCGSGGSITA